MVSRSLYRENTGVSLPVISGREKEGEREEERGIEIKKKGVREKERN